MSLLEIDSLRLSYATRRGVVRAIEEASLVVEPGEAVGLVGESGSGKSSLARAALGLLPHRIGRIDAGRILVDGQDVTHLSPRAWDRRRGNPIATVFQDPMSCLNPVMRIGRQIGESVRRHDPAAGRGRVAELLGLVQLPAAVARAFPHELSGGMRQRALLAVALGCRPRLLIADEPTTALDVTTQAEILRLLRELQGALGMALLLISHDLGVVRAACDRVVIMYAGRTVEAGRTSDVLDAPLHPYAQRLLAAAHAARDADGRFVTVAGEAPVLDALGAGCPFGPRCPVAIAACAEMPPPFMRGTHWARCWLLQ